MPLKVRAPTTLATLALAAIFIAPVHSRAAFEKEEAEFKALIADAKCLSAANLN